MKRLRWEKGVVHTKTCPDKYGQGRTPIERKTDQERQVIDTMNNIGRRNTNKGGVRQNRPEAKIWSKVVLRRQGFRGIRT